MVCIMCHCLRFSCSSEISNPVHCLGMFMKSHKKTVKRLLYKRVLSCSMCGEGKGSSFFCAVGVQLWELPVSTSLSYNRFPDNHLMLLDVWMPPTVVGFESSLQSQSRRSVCHSWSWHSVTAPLAFVFAFAACLWAPKHFTNNSKNKAKN